MAHWGWYWKHKKKGYLPKTLCSDLVSIDSFKVLPQNRPGFMVQPLEISAQVQDGYLTVIYKKQKDLAYTIPIDKLPCNYGGYRYFFKCPLCKKRMRILYLAQHSIFLCRKCLNLCYKTQRLHASKRYAYTEDKINKIIESKGGDLYRKPPRMHNATYQKLKGKYRYYEQKSDQAINKEMRQWFGNKAEPYINEFFDYVDETKG